MHFQLHYQHYLHHGKLLLKPMTHHEQQTENFEVNASGDHTYKGNYHSCQAVIHK